MVRLIHLDRAFCYVDKIKKLSYDALKPCLGLIIPELAVKGAVKMGNGMPDSVRYGLDLDKLRPDGGGDWDKFLCLWSDCQTIEEAVSLLYRLPHFQYPRVNNARRWPLEFVLTVAAPPVVKNSRGSEKVQEAAMRMAEKLLDSIEKLQAVLEAVYDQRSTIRRILEIIRTYGRGKREAQFGPSLQALKNLLILDYLDVFGCEVEVVVPGLKQPLSIKKEKFRLSCFQDYEDSLASTLLGALHELGYDEVIRKAMNERVAGHMAHRLERAIGSKEIWYHRYEYMLEPQTQEYLEGYVEIRDQHPDLFWMMLILAEWQNNTPARRALLAG